MKLRPSPTIANNVYAVTLVLLLLMGLLTAVGAVMSLRVGAMVATISETYVPAYGMLARAHVRSLEQSVALRRSAIVLLEGGDAADRDRLLADAVQAGMQADAEIAAARAGFAAAIALRSDTENLVGLGQLDAGIEALQADRADYAAAFEQVRQVIVAGDRTATVLDLARIDEIRDRMAARIEELRKEALALARATVERTGGEQRKVIWLSLAALVIATIFGLLMASRIARRLVGSVRPLVNATRAVEKGSYSGEVAVLTNDEIGQLAVAFNRMIRELALKDRIQATFGRYMDPRLVEGLVERQDLTGSTGDRRVLTVLFCDMRGFTHLSEQVTPASLVAVLNRYLGLMADEVRAQNGVIDKFIGDSVMAFFGPPFVAAEEQGRRACEAGLGQIRRFEEFRAEVPGIIGFRNFAPDIGIRVGIATGEVIVGNIGSQSSMSYTVIGDTVNAASRIEGASKVYGTRLLIDAQTARLVGGALPLREIDRAVLAGKAEPVTLFEVMTGDPAAAGALRDAYEAGLAALRSRDWTAAREMFVKCLSIAPADGPATLMLERARKHAESPPPEGWDGSFTISEK